MSGDPHLGFIVAAYAAAALVLALLTGAVLLDHRRQERALADLEARGSGRRSRRSAP